MIAHDYNFVVLRFLPAAVFALQFRLFACSDDQHLGLPLAGSSPTRGAESKGLDCFIWRDFMP